MWNVEATAEEIARKYATIKDGRLHGDWYDLSKFVALEALTCAQNQHEQEVKDLKKALLWYAEKAEAISRYMEAEPPTVTAIEAVLTELSLDAGKRALDNT